ncbi:MAG: hypothetical protein JKY54_15160, partial [Flavobacteriales bacterium]|nr:hypothetical protein [Flavobacteriales bacterium]
WKSTIDSEGQIGILKEFTHCFERYEADSLEFYTNRLLEIAIKENNKEAIAFGKHQVAQVLYMRRDWIKAIEMLKESIRLNREIEAYQFVEADLLKSGLICFHNDMYYQSSVYFQDLITHSKKTGNRRLESMSYNNLALVYVVVGMNEKALETSLHGLMLKKELGDKYEIATGSHSVAASYKLLGNEEKTREYTLNAIRILEELQDSLTLQVTYRFWGDELRSQGKHETALGILQKAHGISLNSGDYYHIGISKIELSALLFDMKRLEEAKTFALEGLQSGKKAKDTEIQIEAGILIGKCFLQVQEYEESLLALESVAEIQRTQNTGEYIPALFELLTEVYEKLGDSEGALNSHKLYKLYSDSLQAQNDQLKITESSLKYEFLREKSADSLAMMQKVELAEQESSVLSGEKKEVLGQRNLLLIIAAILVVCAFLIYGYSKKRRIRNQLSSSEKIKEGKGSLANSEEKQALLEGQIITKNKELTSYSLNASHHEHIIEELKAQVNQIRNCDEVSSSDLNRIDNIIRTSDVEKDALSRFILQFEGIHPGYLEHLLQKAPTLNSRDLRICALMKLNMSSNEISTIVGISVDSLRTTRYRIHKKIGLSKGEKLMEFVLNFKAA